MNGGWHGVGPDTLAIPETEVAWAAGFFDGEGSIFVNKQRVPRPERAGSPVYDIVSPNISISQVDRRPLERFARVVGGREVSGPYKPRHEKAREYYRWDACGRPSVHRVLCILWPYLSEAKREQARKVWEELESLKGAKSPDLPPLPTDTVGVVLDVTLAGERADGREDDGG